jgi:hypothetical protein
MDKWMEGQTDVVKIIIAVALNGQEKWGWLNRSALG